MHARCKTRASTGREKGAQLRPRFVRKLADGKTSHELRWKVAVVTSTTKFNFTTSQCRCSTVPGRGQLLMLRKTSNHKYRVRFTGKRSKFGSRRYSEVSVEHARSQKEIQPGLDLDFLFPIRCPVLYHQRYFQERGTLAPSFSIFPSTAGKVIEDAVESPSSFSYPINSTQSVAPLHPFAAEKMIPRWVQVLCPKKCRCSSNEVKKLLFWATLNFLFLCGAGWVLR